MSVRQVIEAFDAWRRAGERMVLATVTATTGSTYSKPGAQMLISGGGQFRGLLSGGCLESDLVDHAREVLAGGAPKVVRYDMRDRDEDELWGLGLGCDGSIEIFLCALGPAHEPFAAIARRVRERARAASCLVLASTLPALRAGATLIAGDGGIERWGVPDAHVDDLARLCRESLEDGGTRRLRIGIAATDVDVLCSVIAPSPSVLVLGAGPDALPLVRIARELGWYVTVADHRPAYVERMRGSGADRVIEVVPARLAEAFDASAFDAAVIMSHHLRSDRDYLRALCGSSLTYIGLLGPRARRERLLADLEAAADGVANRTYGPVGLDIGADTPEAIALAIAAQIQAVLRGRAAGHFDR